MGTRSTELGRTWMWGLVVVVSDKVGAGTFGIDRPLACDSTGVVYFIWAVRLLLPVLRRGHTSPNYSRIYGAGWRSSLRTPAGLQMTSLERTTVNTSDPAISAGATSVRCPALKAHTSISVLVLVRVRCPLLYPHGNSYWAGAQNSLAIEGRAESVLFA